MPEPFKSEHPKYISNYNKTRKGNVMGKERGILLKKIFLIFQKMFLLNVKMI